LQRFRVITCNNMIPLSALSLHSLRLFEGHLQPRPECELRVHSQSASAGSDRPCSASLPVISTSVRALFIQFHTFGIPATLCDADQQDQAASAAAVEQAESGWISDKRNSRKQAAP
jgi:hypothetical protein